MFHIKVICTNQLWQHCEASDFPEMLSEKQFLVSAETDYYRLIGVRNLRLGRKNDGPCFFLHVKEGIGW